LQDPRVGQARGERGDMSSSASSDTNGSTSSGASGAKSGRHYLGVDVGTGSVRAAIFDASGARAGLGVAPIRIFRPEEDFVEQSSDDIWSACGAAVRAALAEAKVP